MNPDFPSLIDRTATAKTRGRTLSRHSGRNSPSLNENAPGEAEPGGIESFAASLCEAISPDAPSPDASCALLKTLEMTVRALRVESAALVLFNDETELLLAHSGTLDTEEIVWARAHGRQVLQCNRAQQWNAATSDNTTRSDSDKSDADKDVASENASNISRAPFYAAAPLRNHSLRDSGSCDSGLGNTRGNVPGKAFGVLSVACRARNRVLDCDEMAQLQDLADLVSREVALRFSLRNAQRQAQAARDEMQSTKGHFAGVAQLNNQLQAAVFNAAVGIVVSDPNLPDNPIVFANPAFYEMTGYEPHEIIGKNCRFLQGAATNQDVIHQIRLSVQIAQHCRHTMVNYRKNGTPFWNDLTMSPVHDADEKLVNFVGIQRDVTDSMEKAAAVKRAHDELELRVQMRTLDLSRANQALALSNATLEESHGHLRALAARLESAQEKERARISREIHDELGQELTGLRMQLAWLERRLSPSQSEETSGDQELHGHLTEMARQIDVSIGSVRRIASDLRPEVLDRFGLCEALEWQAQEFQKKAGIRCTFKCSCIDKNIERDLATAIFRIAQEALTNVLRHAQASRVSLTLKESEGALHLCISDNGIGIESSKAAAQNPARRQITTTDAEMVDEQKSARDQREKRGETGLKETRRGQALRVPLGILGMSERAIILGGQLWVQSGGGTTIRVRFPYGARAGEQ